MKKTGNKIKTGKWKKGSIIAALLSSVAVFVIMLQIEKGVMDNYVKETVLVAITDIPKGTKVSEDSLQDYYDWKEVDATVIPASACRGIEQVVNKMIKYEVDAGSIVTEGMFTDEEEFRKDYKEPVIAGIKADDLYQVIGGRLRTGDVIHIFAVKEDGLGKSWDNIRVHSVYDQNGAFIQTSDETSPAQRINLYLEKDEVEDFYAELTTGSLRVVKLCKEF